MRTSTTFSICRVSLRTWFGQLKALFQFVFERGWRAALAVAGFAAVAASIYAMSQVDLANGPFGLTSLNVVGLLAGAGAFARAVLPGVKIIGGLIASTSGFAARLDDKLKKEIKQVAQAEDKLQRAAAETEARRAAAERAAKSLARYVDPGSEDRQSTAAAALHAGRRSGHARPRKGNWPDQPRAPSFSGDRRDRSRGKAKGRERRRP